jgi:hypothetical protein
MATGLTTFQFFLLLFHWMQTVFAKPFDKWCVYKLCIDYIMFILYW